MFNKRADRGWSPYLAGALSGLLVVVSTYATTQLLGKTNHLDASATYVRAAGLIEEKLWPAHVEKSAYFRKEKTQVDWQFMLVFGVFVGALVAALTGNAFESESVPPLWAKRFGPNPLWRGVCAFAGGAVAMLGARLADGCPSSHGLSGLMQLSVSGLAAMACIFLGGIAVAAKVYRKGGSL